MRSVWFFASFSPAASFGAADAGRALNPAAPSAASPPAIWRNWRRPRPTAASRCESSSICSSGMCGRIWASLVLVLFGVERVTHAVAEEREREHRDGDRDGREDAQVPVRAQVLLS